jgi:dihydroflavonol-4-reductase
MSICDRRNRLPRVAKTLVTGGNGFLGSAVVRLLAARGDSLRLTRRRRSRLENVKDVEHEAVQCDVLDRAAVRRALKGVDRVFHLAGLVSMRPEDDQRLFDVNVGGTRIVLEECLRAGVERVVYTSSVGAIGPAEEGGATDERQVFTAGRLGIPYINSKHEAEVEAFRLAAKGLPVVVVNPAYVLGRGDVYARATSIVRRFLLGRIPAYVPGALNVVDVQDVAHGHLLADERGAVGERYILGNRNYTLDRLWADLSRVSGVEPPALRLSAGVAMRLAQAAEAASRGRAPITVQEVRLSSQWWTYRNTKAKRELAWRPSPHEETIEATVAWYRDREGDRLARAGSSQPLQYKLAATAVGALGGAAKAAGRLWPLGGS